MQAAQAGLQRAVEKQRGLEAQVSEQQGHARGLQRELIRCVEGGVHLALQARSCSSQAGDIAFPVATLNNKSIEMLLSPLYHCTPSPDKSRYTHSSQEALAAREYELKAQGTQLSGEVERLRREQAATVGRLDAAGAELAEVRAALAKRERELSDFQQVRTLYTPET